MSHGGIIDRLGIGFLASRAEEPLEPLTERRDFYGREFHDAC